MSDGHRHFIWLAAGQLIAVAVGLTLLGVQAARSFREAAEDQLAAAVTDPTRPLPSDHVVLELARDYQPRTARRADGSPLPGAIELLGVGTWDADPPLRFRVGDDDFVGAATRGLPEPLVVALPAAHAERTAAAYARPLSALSVLAGVWIAALCLVATYIALARMGDRLSRERLSGATRALRQAHECVRTQEGMIFALAKLAESRDRDTGGHLERICAFSTALALAARGQPPFARELGGGVLDQLGTAAVLHDIGKVAVPDEVLHKRGRLTPTEHGVIQSHTVRAAELLDEVARRYGSSSLLRLARNVALHHHEAWDGSGYPHGLAGRDIPLAARIVAIADVYDALSTARCYKPALAHDECVRYIRNAAGSQFDPELVALWLTIAPEFDRIRRRLAAATGEPQADGGIRSSTDEVPALS